MDKELYEKRMGDAGDALRDPARDHALAFVARWAERTGKALDSEEAEAVYEEAYGDACEAMSDR